MLPTEMSSVPLTHRQDCTMPLKSKPAVDQDGDIVMSNTPAPAQISPLKDKFNFEWFSFDGKSSSPKSPTYSPASPSESSRKLSVSTASPSTYFTDSPVRKALEVHDHVPARVIFPPPPTKPLRWVWQCHQCHSRYPLSVTRRCLVDGHYYCSGNTQNQRNIKKRRRQQSCTSEFDYVAWKEWGQWKRKTLALHAFANGEPEPKLLGCNGCGSPSQCRYESRKAVETIKFDDFVEADDLVLDDAIVVDRRRVSDGRHASPTPSSAISDKDKKGGKSKKKSVEKDLKIDIDPALSTSDQRFQKRHRFYSNFAGSLSGRDPSPTSDTFSGADSGRFDPNLPSVTKSTVESRDGGEVTAMESSLKTALAHRKQRTPSPGASEVSRRSPRLSQRRVNSKVDDPEFESTSSNSQSGEEMPMLQRTGSQQSPLTDFFRTTRSMTSKQLSSDGADSLPASEADIAAFLQAKTAVNGGGRAPRSQREHSLSSARDFEDIAISPSTPDAPRKRSQSVEPKMPRSSQSASDDDQALNSSTNGGESGRLGIMFGLPGFVFGRK